MADRITPYAADGHIEKRIDEIVLLDGAVHIEMMDNRRAWMRIGAEIFWIESRDKELVLRWSETRPE